MNGKILLDRNDTGPRDIFYLKGHFEVKYMCILEEPQYTPTASNVFIVYFNHQLCEQRPINPITKRLFT